MKILVDVNLSPLWVEWLQQAGFEAVYWSSFGASSAPDSLIQHFAREQSYVILTLDLDFGLDLADSQQSRPSVVQIRGQFAHSEAMREHVISTLHKTVKNSNRVLSLRSSRTAFAFGGFPSNKHGGNKHLVTLEKLSHPHLI